MFLMVYVVYANIDTISTSVRSLLVSTSRPSIAVKNEYTRSYNYVNFNYSEDFVPYTKDEIINIYFNIINDGMSEFEFYCPSDYKECAKDVENIGKDNTLLSDINNYVHPYNSFLTINTMVSNNGKVIVKVNHKYSDDKIEIINNKVSEVISSLGLDGLSTVEKIERVHNYIINNAEYDNDSDNSTYDSTSAYGTLIEGKSVCSGYSDSMAIFLDILKIPNLKVKSENHIWNLVYVGGKWYHLDLTWDDTGNEKYGNDFFLITKEKLFELDSKEHMFDESFFIEAR